MKMNGVEKEREKKDAECLKKCLKKMKIRRLGPEYKMGNEKSTGKIKQIRNRQNETWI